MITVEPLSPARIDGHIVLRAKVTGHPRGDLLEMRFPERAESFLSTDRADCWLLAMLLPAMELGDVLHIEGRVSEQLLFSINKQLVPLLAQFYEVWLPIRVTAAASAVPIVRQERVAATGFSGGVDSFATVADHIAPDVPDHFKLGLLLFCSTGQFGDNREWFENDLKAARLSSEKFGLDLIDVVTNFDSFFSTDFVCSHTLRNLSIPLAMQMGVLAYPYSSAVPYRGITFHTNETAYIDSIMIPLMCTESILFWSAGSEYTRAEKTALLSQVPESYSGLYVCLRGYEKHRKLNCSKCSKCIRTMTTLDLLDVLTRYESVFDLDSIKSKRSLYVRALSSSDPAFVSDIVSLAIKRGKGIPWSWKALASVIRNMRDLAPAWLRWRLFKRFPTIFVS